MRPASGPLAGVKVVELGGVGPAPFCGMYLGDLGADVVRIDRKLGDDPLSQRREKFRMLSRNKRSVSLDIRQGDGLEAARALVERAGIVIEGFRPGVAERLGLGPEDCLKLNAALVYGRITGWGAKGPMADSAGHDINYLALTGALAAIGPPDTPLPPLNLVADFGGGAMSLLVGLLAAHGAAARTGRGQVVDASIVGGTLSLMSMVYAIRGHGDWVNRRGANYMDGAAPFYRAYQTSDGAFMAVGSVEPQFYAALIELLDLKGVVDPARQMQRETWPRTAELFANAFRRRTREQWVEAMKAVDACVSPVLSMDEAVEHPQLRATEAFVQIGGHAEPSPQPRFSATPTRAPSAPESTGASTRRVLEELGYGQARIEQMLASGVAYQSGTNGG